MSKTLTLYTKPACVQCVQTKRWLDRAGLDYTTVDVTVDVVALRYVTQTLGYRSAPVIHTTVDGHIKHWHGFRPDLLNHYKES